jgi:hypothetical protein
MSEIRIFLYSGNVDDAFKEAAKKSLIEAKWMPIYEVSKPVHLMACTGSDRRTCDLLQCTEYPYASVAERS